jgi:hypothetical protein
MGATSTVPTLNRLRMNVAFTTRPPPCGRPGGGTVRTSSSARFPVA